MATQLDDELEQADATPASSDIPGLTDSPTIRSSQQANASDEAAAATGHQLPFGVVMEPGSEGAAPAVGGYFFTIDEQGQIHNDTDIPTAQMLGAASQSGLPVYVRQGQNIFRGMVDPRGGNVRAIGDPITPSNDLARSLGMSEAQQHIFIERHLENLADVEHLIQSTAPAQTSSAERREPARTEPRQPRSVSTPNQSPIQTEAGAPASFGAHEGVPGFETVGPTTPPLSSSPEQSAAQGSVGLPDQQAVIVESESPPTSEAGELTAGPASSEHETEAPVDVPGVGDVSQGSSPAIATGGISQRSRPETEGPAEAQRSLSPQTQQPEVPATSSPHPDLPTLGQESSPAYPTTGIIPQRPGRSRQRTRRQPTSRRVASGNQPAGNDAAFGESSLPTTAGTAPAGKDERSSTRSPRYQQSARPSGAGASTDVPFSPRSSSADAGGGAESNDRISPAFTDTTQNNPAVAQPTYGRRKRRSPRLASSPYEEPVEEVPAVSAAAPVEEPGIDDQGGNLVGVDEPYQPFVNPTDDQTPGSARSATNGQGDGQFEEPGTQTVADQTFPTSDEQTWSKDLAKQKMEQLRETRRSVARNDTPAASTDEQPENVGPLDQIQQAANSYQSPSMLEKAARHGSNRALRNAQGKSKAQVAQDAEKLKREFLLKAQRRAWQLAQEMAEDAAIGAPYLFFVTFPLVTMLYASRWFFGNMLGSMVTRDIGGVTLPMVPGYAIGDLADYPHHIKSLLISLITMAIVGFIVMLLYYYTNWTAAFVAALDAGVHGGWGDLINLLHQTQL